MPFAVVGAAFVGAALLSFPSVAQQKTVKACTEEWQANKDANQAKGVTLKAYVTQCRAGGAAQPELLASTPSTPSTSQKRRRLLRRRPVETVEGLRRGVAHRNKAANEAKGITQKAYVADCRTANDGPADAVPTRPQQPRQRRRQLRNRRARHQGRQPGLHHLQRRRRRC